ncbi:hypothetical protein SAMN06296952_2204 [Oscillospiraceae bacterium]|nr:hypothetical protein SAMN06296952_2204 [Oscillospiraceae bacterium]
MFGYISKRKIALALEALPVICAPLSYLLMVNKADNSIVRGIIGIATVIAFFGFVFCIIGRKMVKGDKAIAVLGILDILATIFILGIYVIAVFSFGL